MKPEIGKEDRIVEKNQIIKITELLMKIDESWKKIVYLKKSNS